jgi:small Trp-rich protein
LGYSYSVFNEIVKRVVDPKGVLKPRICEEITMYAVGLGVILILMKYMSIDPVTNWAWWIILSPFGVAFVWWMWADASGWTRKKAMQREVDRKQARIDKNREATGTLRSGRRR